MGDLSLIQIVMVLVIALLVFGPGRMPEIGRQVGKGLRDLRRHASSMTGELARAMDDDETLPQDRSKPTPGAGQRPSPPQAIPDGELLAGVVVDGSTAAQPAPTAAPPATPQDSLLDGVVVPGTQLPSGPR